MAAVAIWMAIWWITEAVPLAVTALLPVVVFPLLHIMPGKKVAPLYFNSVIFLFLGGFILALAMQRWNLHRRVALLIVRWLGVGQRRLMLGFMLATAFLSMWISNTATTMMMMPIALAVILKLEDEGGSERFGTGLLLAIGYAASLGGIATLVGTPPNLSFARILAIVFPEAPEISFAQWMLLALPLSVVMMAITWLFLSYRFAGGQTTGNRENFDEELARLGPLSREEKLVALVFVAMATAWLTRSNLSIGAFTFEGWASRLDLTGLADDGTVAIGFSILLFLLPARDGGRLMAWKDCEQVPWGIVLLFGGGFALAAGFKESGLSVWSGERMAGLGQLGGITVVLAICLTITFLTELTSNTATTEMVLPILAASGVAMGVNPLMLMVPATLSASCAFMLPVATPPNAIVFGTGRIKMAEMAKTGIALNILGAIAITLLIYFLGGPILQIQDGVLPGWAASAH